MSQTSNNNMLQSKLSFKSKQSTSKYKLGVMNSINPLYRRIQTVRLKTANISPMRESLRDSSQFNSSNMQLLEEISEATNRFVPRGNEEHKTYFLGGINRVIKDYDEYENAGIEEEFKEVGNRRTRNTGLMIGIEDENGDINGTTGTMMMYNMMGATNTPGIG